LDKERTEYTITMDKNRQYKIALVLYTSGIDYDDRIRKEMLSIMKLYPNVSFKIFAVEPKNREEEGVSSYGVPYRIPYLKTRDKYASATHTMAKAFDFYKTIRKELKAYDAVWCADIETSLFVLFNCHTPLIWDLHELPTRFMGNPIMRKFFRFLSGKCKVMVHANEPRLQCLRDRGMIKSSTPQYVIRNYPQFNEIDTEYDEQYHQFEQWLREDKCIYLQGLNEPTRAPFESISAVLQVPGLKCVVVGRVDKDAVAKVRKEYGDVVDNRVYFTGLIKQLKTPQYIRKCFASLVFYKNSCLNNWYCEANRFYQNIINGNPVITGANPPMKELIDKYGFGIAISSDGSKEEEIKEAILQIDSHFDSFLQNIEKHKDNLLWDNQKEIFVGIIDNLLK